MGEMLVLLVISGTLCAAATAGLTLAVVVLRRRGGPK